ncbi:MAG: DUF4132 domain-containing protein [Catenulispora sp.]|nr:DUF4132 domain-containing protein [Catenulispora sp.]
MGNVLASATLLLDADPVDAAAGLFAKHRDLRALVVPRRDGASSAPGGVPPHPTEPPLTRPDAAAKFEKLFATARPTLETALRHGAAAKDLVQEASRPELDDPALRTPRQAAIAAAAVLFDARHGLEPAEIADAWVAARGLPFAAEAAVELAGFVISLLHKSNDTPALRRSGGDLVHRDERFEIGARVRRHLVTASDPDHAAAHAAVEGMSGLTAEQHAAVAFLFPERTSLVDHELQHPNARRSRAVGSLATLFLLGAVTTRAQALAFAQGVWVDVLRQNAAATATAFATVGVDLAPALAHWIGETWDAEEKLRLQGLLAGLDSDEAMRAQFSMLDTRGAAMVLLDAAARFPERGVRLLSTEAPTAPAARATLERALRMHVTARPEIARAVLPVLGADAAARVEKVLSTAEKVPAADPATLPDLLVRPPWEQERAAMKPVVVKDLTAPAENDVVWLDEAEREQWLTDTLSDPRKADQDWDKHLREIRNRRNWYLIALLIVRGPEEAARTALAQAEEGHPWDARDWAKPAIARFGADALPAVLNAIPTDVVSNAELILPFASSEAALLAADWNARLKSLRPVAQAWLRRHPGVAARTLIPTALAKPGKARQAAEAALRLVAAAGFEAEIREAAAGYGAAAEAGIANLLAVDPLVAALPKTMPELPAWAEPRSLPQLLLAGRERALPVDSARNVVRMLTVSQPDAPYPGLAIVKELCDARSLAAFAWGLFENWQAAGHPAKQPFGFDVLRWFGDDDTVRRLSPLIRAWPGEGGHARAVTGLDVLAAIGGDTALIHLYGISQKVKFKGLKETAQARIAAIAEEMRLTREQLADRLVPDLGLNDAGALELDYGPRRFTVFFDEQLKPGVVDEAGKRLKALPKPGAKDDSELAPAAYQRFAGLKKDVRTLATDQIARLELAMVTRRRWSESEFEEFLVGHPLLRHVVRRLVWGDFASDGTELRAAFRVAEDLSYADVEDDSFALAADATIGVAHPADLADDVARWSEVFADYEILQPFDQLGRPVFRLTEQEAAGTELRRFADAKANGGRVLGMERRGWRRSEPADAGWQGQLLRELPDGRMLVVELDPGFGAGWADAAEDQQFRSVWINPAKDSYYGYQRHRGSTAAPFSVLDPVTASEVLRDLTEVTTG